MTSDPLEQVTRALRSAVADPGEVDALPAGRDAAVARIADALRARAEARRRRRVLTGLAVAAGVALASGGALTALHAGGEGTRAHDAPRAPDLGRVDLPGEGVTAVREGRTEPLGAGARVAEGTELRTTGASEAHLAFDSGTRVTLGGAARVRLVEQNQRKRFALESGSFFAKVAKLGPEERFVVATPDAEIEVRGTAFRVRIVAGDPACAAGTPTRLDVSEGVVVVRHAGAEVRVAAGEQWPTCNPPAAVAPSGGLPAPTLAASSPVANQGQGATAASSHAGGATAAAETSSRLAEQNDLFDEAMRLKRAGDAAGASAKLDRLLRVYPRGPLAESAEVERMRLLASSDRPRAAAAAREYLRRHPRGFAHAEASALVTGTP